MKVVWASQALNDYRYFQAFEPAVASKINALLEDIRRNPFSGVGKPEPLRGELSGFWSRRITKKHRLVYRVAVKPGVDQRLEIAKCRLHY
ncbi:MAG TPA: Txe/YoeB family addiction module toxin [Micropepsaceae bacterium]|nr:Txe/YoeB family addiction module toxin [Micropepsaceae bacterium]